ncbi:MAG TPA: M23 family metallopeptidase [Anaeromyxobacter sp.]|nr:M23 family metallopeptidase [Anaeromyxobacter sp.]
MVSLAIDRPPSSQHGRARGVARRIGSAVVLAGVLGAGFWLGRVTAPAARASATPAATPTATPTPTSTSTSTATATATPTATPTPTSTPTPTATATSTSTAGPRRVVATVSGSLEDSIAAAMASGDRALAEQLTQVVNRLLVWQLQVARDGRRGDRIEVLWTPPAAAGAGVPASGEPVVDAVRYTSSKLGGVFAAYRWQPDGARWARYYRADGSEIELRLVDSPIGDYEQVTSLLRDGRRHKGVDFRTPVGSPVRAPFDGVIERRNWNFAGNGNCLDLRDPATGRHAIFLHLDVLPKELAPGRTVRKGEVIASSGNSGRSFAPHLHYQLEDAGGKVLDPFAIHRTERRSLPGEQKARFDAARAQLDARLTGW